MREKSSNDSGGTISPWTTNGAPEYWGSLEARVAVDVCVIGAGIAGLSVAYHLACAGRSVIVIDSGPVGGGETGRTTAHLASALDDRFTWLEKVHGLEGAQLAADSHAAAIDSIEAICEVERIACDFKRVDGYLFGPGGTTPLLAAELSAAHRAGLDVTMIPRVPLLGFDSGPCLRFSHQAQFHPLDYLRGLAAAILRRGGHIYTGVRAENIDGSGEIPIVTTDGGHEIAAEDVVVATNAPINSLIALPIKEAAYRSYVVGLRVPRGTVPTALYWDTEDPYHYARLIEDPAADAAEDTLIVGGEDHRTGHNGSDANERYQRLVAWARDRFVGATEVVWRWSGQILEPSDGLAFIGRSPGEGEHIYVATGDSGHGMTHGALAGMLLTDLIVGRPNPWATLYDPSRSSLKAPRQLLREAVASALPYRDWFGRGDVATEEEIAPGTGAVVRHGLQLVAAYREPAGHLHRLSAKCPHLGGVVHWNAAEKSWDCPCHGSRFDCTGRVLNGPAASDLSPIDPEPHDRPQLGEDELDDGVFAPSLTLLLS